MRGLLLSLALGGCASVSANEAPCACIVRVPSEAINGVVSLALDGEPVDFANFSNQRMPANAVLWAVGEPFASGNALAISGAWSLFVEADFGPVLDLTRPVPISRLRFAGSLSAGVEPVGAPHYDLGSWGGTLRVSEIAREADGGYPIRGGFTAQLCPQGQHSAEAPCRDLEGRFAFSRDGLPEGAVTGNLLASAA